MTKAKNTNDIKYLLKNNKSIFQIVRICWFTGLEPATFTIENQFSIQGQLNKRMVLK